MGNRTVKLAVQLIIRIEQIERDTAYIDSPYISMYIVVQIGNIHDHLIAVLVEYTVDRQLAEVLSFVIGNLLTIHRQSLREVTVTIEETYRTQVNIAVRSFLQVIAGQYAQTTRIYFQNVIQTIFHTEIGHGGTLLVGLHIHICTELRVYIIHSAQDNLIIRKRFKFSIAHTFQQKHGILSYLFPQSRVKVSEQFGSLIIPRPPDVACQFRQFLQLSRNVRLYIHIFPVRSVYITNFNLHCI